MSPTRRRWNLRVHDRDDAERVLVISVPPDDGTVWASIGDLAIKLSPEDVSRIVAAYRQAQAQALQDRGTW